MDQKEREQQQPNPGNERNREDTNRPADNPNRDEELQREGNLGNERNRNQPDSERRPGGDRENLNR